MQGISGNFKSQMRAMIAALNAHLGLMATVPELKQSFLFYGGLHNFAKFLDTAIEKYPKHITIVYERTPGSYTQVFVRVEKEIISNM